MFTEEAEGTIPVYRLRKQDGHQTYLLSVNKDEISRMSGRFENEGVVGYVYADQEDDAMPLVRYSKNSDWRVGREGRVDLVVAGYGVDGVMGYVPRS